MENLKKTIQYTIQRIYKAIYRFFYFVLEQKSIDEKKIVVYTYRSNQLEGNLKAIVREIQKTHPEMHIEIRKAPKQMGLALFKELPAIANAKIVLLDDYFLPVYLINPRKETKFVQLWHAAGAFKKFGYSTKDTKFGPSSQYLNIVPVHMHYSHVYVSSKAVVPYYAEAFNMSENQVYPLGIPRTDLLGEEVVPSDALTPVQLERCKVLIAPTYRAKSGQSESNLDWLAVLQTIAPQLAPHIQLIVMPHPYSDRTEWSVLTQFDNIVLDYQHPLNEWMPIADAFITDYSSAIFEFALFERPLAHYVPDLAEYTASRGLYRPLEAISDGTILQEQHALVSWINNRKNNEQYDTSRMVEFNFSHTEDVSKKIVQHLFESN